MTRGTRKLHTWIGLIASIPFLIMITTALLIGNGSQLKLGRFQVQAGWLPAYRKELSAPQLHAVLLQQNEQYLGTTAGLFIRHGKTLTPVQEIGEVDVRALLGEAHGVMAVTSKGLWSNASGTWRRVLKGNVLSATMNGNKVVALTRRRVQVSEDGGATWRVNPPFRMPAVHASAIPLTRLITDLHSGRAFFGQRSKWIWVDIVALSFGVMVGSGLWGWFRTKRAKAKAREFARAKAAEGAAALARPS
jgi:hypothetical protein